MMSGLEISEIKLSELIIDNEKYRFDSEFFQKIYIDTYTAIKKHSFKQLSALIDVLTDFHANGSYESIAQNFSLLDDPNYAYMVRSTDLEKSNYINDVKYVSEHSYNFLAKSKVLGGELLINKIGSPGRTYLMPTLNRPVSLGMNLFMIRLKNNSLVNNIFVWLFLNTSLGKHVINRKVNGTVPLTIDKEAIKSLPIPIVSVKFQKYLKHIVNRAESILNDSKALYSAAESRLLSALGMDNFTPSAEPVAVKSFSESFGTSGRLDAEYYQQKYDSLFHKIGKHACKRLGDLVKIEKSIEPGSDFYSDDGIPFVRVSDITKFGIQQPD
ncbi:MAG: hypothetical protein LBV04_06120, partial [Deferribacteraceae bacterium]|nr:hypothetical protein [Deferribacteraceae bacterium]